VPDYEVVPEEEADKVARRKRPKPRMPALTIERYGGRLVYIWFGMRAGDLLRLFKRGRYNFTLNCIPDVIALWFWVPWNGVLRRISEAKYAKRAEEVKLDTPPVFILGHWRTGTTLLHDLFAEDPSLAYPTTYECFFPHHFLVSEGRLDRVFRILLPKRRPQDDVPVGFDRPQEEEFALMMLGLPSPYLTMAWPRFGPADSEYFELKGVPEQARKSWADGFMWFYRRLVLKHGGKRLVMKSPPNTSRLALLTEMFPNARYVYLVRNPINLFSSTVKLWRALYSTQGLHNPPHLDPWLDDYVLDTLATMTDAYERDRHLVPEDRRVEIRFEDFIKDPIASMRDIYTRLGISGFEQAEPKMRAFLDARSEHSVSKYRLPEPLRRKIVDRMGPFIDRYGYREAVEAAAAAPGASGSEQKPKAAIREREPS
jgi:hypothetical protein